MTRIYILAGLVVVALSSVYFGYRYVSNMQEDLTYAKSQVESMTLILESKEESIRIMKEGIERQQQLHDALQSSLSETRNDVAKITKVFGNHDFANLLKKKPGLVHTRMLRATRRLFNDIEEASRSN